MKIKWINFLYSKEEGYLEDTLVKISVGDKYQFMGETLCTIEKIEYVTEGYYFIWLKYPLGGMIITGVHNLRKDFKKL